MTSTIAFMTANFVARETGYAMEDWGHGDRTTQAAFAPIETYAERIDAILGEIRALGFETVDVWGAHLHPSWATDEHVAALREALARHELAVSTYAAWLDLANVDRACELARALGVTVIGAGFSGEPETLAPVLEAHDVRLGIENHPERTPAEVIAKIERGGPAFGATVDTGWWGTHGYDAAAAIEELGPHILHVHLKDVVALGIPHETCRWGEGIVPIEECVRALQRMGYEGAITVEHEPNTADPSEACGAMKGELEGWLR